MLEVTRSDNGDASYRLLIDGEPQKLKGSVAKWDDATPWEAGTYDAAFSKLRGKYDAFLIKYPPNRSEIKFHLGTETGHSEGCIVAKTADISEIEKVLADNQIPKDTLKFDVKGDFPIAFKLSIRGNAKEVERGASLFLTLELTGGGAPGGVSKDIWFHIIADKLDGHQFALSHPEKMPHYVSRSSYSDSKKGVLVRFPKGDRTHDYEIKLISPHATPIRHGHAPVAAPAPPPRAGPAVPQPPNVQVVFSIDNYKILNKAPGPAHTFTHPRIIRWCSTKVSKPHRSLSNQLQWCAVLNVAAEGQAGDAQGGRRGCSRVMTPQPLFVAYYRVSTDRQGRSGLGLDAQRKAVSCQVHRAGGAIVADFTEIESGKRADRPELRAALAEAKRHRATLVIARLDRLSRNMAFIANLMDARVDFIACDNPHATRLTLHILAAVAEHEREMISARTKAALAIAKARGVRLGTPPAYGRERAAATHRGRADRFAATVRDTIGGMAGQGMSLRAIARELDRRGVPTARGGAWQAVQVRAVLARVGS